MNRTVLDVAKVQDKMAFANWDNWSYQIIAPVSLDDLAIVTVFLVNQSGRRMQISLRIAND